MEASDYKTSLKKKMDEFVHSVYRATGNFPSEEKFGVTPQLRRSALSVILNYIEGFARRKRLVQLNFLEISYGSLKESRYLIYFSFIENYIDKEEYEKLINFSDEIGAMLWTEINSLEKSVKK